MTRTETIVNRARWTLAAVIVLGTAFLIIQTRMSTGFERQGTQWFTIGVWAIASVAIPALIVFDFVVHLFEAGIQASEKQYGLARQIAVRTIVADGLLLLLTLAAAIAILKLATSLG